MTDGRTGSANRVDVPALRKGLVVLELLAGFDGLTMTEIQRRTSLGKTMTFRILRVLAEQGYVEHDPLSRRYSLGLRLLEFGTAVSQRLNVVSISQPFIAQLREEFRETVNVGIAADGDIVYVAMAESHQGLRMAARQGSRDPMHSTSIGKAILAFLPAEQREAHIAASPLHSLTPHTITDTGELRRELDRVRERGYAVDNEENELGARCVGVPILDDDGTARAGLSVSGPRGRIGDERIEEIAEGLWRASQAISQRLGHTSPVGVMSDRKSQELDSDPSVPLPSTAK